MSRRDEVDLEIAELDDSYSARTYTDGYAALARILSDEVDALRGQLLALGKKATRYENEREINAGLVVERDAVITRLLAMLEPGEKPVREKLMDYEEWGLVLDQYSEKKRIHARACEIAGRKE